MPASCNIRNWFRIPDQNCHFNKFVLENSECNLPKAVSALGSVVDHMHLHNNYLSELYTEIQPMQNQKAYVNIGLIYLCIKVSNYPWLKLLTSPFVLRISCPTTRMLNWPSIIRLSRSTWSPNISRKGKNYSN